MIAAGLAGAIIAGVPYVFAYSYGMAWFNHQRRLGPPPSEFFSVESFAFYGLCGFPFIMAAAAALSIRLFVPRVSRQE
jgi:hypothetical protein